MHKLITFQRTLDHQLVNVLCRVTTRVEVVEVHLETTTRDEFTGLERTVTVPAPSMLLEQQEWATRNAHDIATIARELGDDD